MAENSILSSAIGFGIKEVADVAFYPANCIDIDKDGKISDAEKEAIKAEFKKNAPKFRKHGRHGKRCCNKCAK